MTMPIAAGKGHSFQFMKRIEGQSQDDAVKNSKPNMAVRIVFIIWFSAISAFIAFGIWLVAYLKSGG
jgi:hypothetical protein